METSHLPSRIPAEGKGMIMENRDVIQKSGDIVQKSFISGLRPLEPR